MYRRCVLCGWGRKECLQSVKFYCIPKEAGLQKLEWMRILADKRANGFKKVDSVCSIHFKSQRPNPDPTHVDFVPNLYLNRQTLPESLRKACLRHYSTETPEVAEKREARLKTLNTRAKTLKEKLSEPRDAWLERKREREEQRKQNRSLGYNPENVRWKTRPSESVVRNFVIPDMKEDVDDDEEMEDIEVDLNDREEHEEEIHVEDEEIVVEEHDKFEHEEQELYQDGTEPVLEVAHEEEVVAEDEPEVELKPMLSYVRPDISKLAASSKRIVPHRQYYITQPPTRRTAPDSHQYPMEDRVVYVRRPV